MSFRDKMLKKYEDMKKNYDNRGGEFLKLKKGESYEIRIVPFGKDQDGDYMFFYEQTSHWMGVGSRHNCPASGDEPSECPICEWVGRNIASDDERKKAVAIKIKARKSYLMNILHDGQLKILSLPTSGFLDIVNWLNTPGWENGIDPVKGNNLILKVESTGPKAMNVKYCPNPMRESSRIAETPEQVKVVYQSTKKLDKVFGVKPDLQELAGALKAALQNRDFMADAVNDWKANRKPKKNDFSSDVETETFDLGD